MTTVVKAYKLVTFFSKYNLYVLKFRKKHLVEICTCDSACVYAPEVCVYNVGVCSVWVCV